jgi:Fe-S-cluster containining protein
MRKGKCRQCGYCCSAIVILYGAWSIREKKCASLKFILKNWIPISRVEAIRRNSELACVNNGFFWTCLLFDERTRKCGNYKGRPRICSEYPWYGEKPKGNAILIRKEGCGYAE